MTDYTSVPNFYISFLPKLGDLQSHQFMNSYFAGLLPDPTLLYLDGATMSILKDEQDLLNEIRRQISTDLIGKVATQTTDPTAISTIVDAA